MLLLVTLAARAAAPLPDLAVPGAPAGRVAAAIAERFGTGVEVRQNTAGRVQLPLAVRYDAARLAEEVAREHLDTPERAEKAEIGVGPGGAWRHFLGADPAGTDCWADPVALVKLVHLAADWQAHCTANLGHDTDRCALMVGDLAFLDDRRPDPLGHKDHYRGDCVDLRLWRTDGSRYEAWWNRPDDRPGYGFAYDPATTRAFVAFAAARPDVSSLLFNDPEALGATPARGHDDHIHLCFDTRAAAR